MSALTGAKARVEQRVEAWENHYLPHIIDRIPVYVPTEEKRNMRDQETPTGTPERVSSSTRPMPMHESQQEVMDVDQSPLALIQENSLRNQCAGVVQGDATGTAVCPVQESQVKARAWHIQRACVPCVCVSGMCARYPRRSTYFFLSRLIALSSLRCVCLRPPFLLSLALLPLLASLVSSLPLPLLRLPLHAPREAQQSLLDMNLPCMRHVSRLYLDGEHLEGLLLQLLEGILERSMCLLPAMDFLCLTLREELMKSCSVTYLRT